MNKRHLILTILVLSAALVIPVLVGAQPNPRMQAQRGPGVMPGPGPFWQNDRMAEDLGLTDDQIAQLEALDEPHREFAEANQEAVRSACDEMKTALDANDADAVRDAAATIGALKSDMTKDRAEFDLGVRSILTDEQWEQLQQHQGSPPQDDHSQGGRHQTPRQQFRGF